MPNTLAHIGTQSLLSAAVIEKNDFKWLLLGCIVPDIPWIIRRALVALHLSVSPYAIECYFSIQASLFCCVFLSLALALFSKRSIRAFTLLVINAIVHLLLDTLQIKWGNGVLLFAPFSWHMTCFGLFWPESLSTIVLTAAGMLVAGYALVKVPFDAVDLAFPTGGKLWLLAAAACIYAIVPLAYINHASRMDIQYIGTLRDRGMRQGKAIAFDRRPTFHTSGNCTIQANTGEELFIAGLGSDCGGLISVKGVFVDTTTIRVVEKHRHWDITRNILNYLGLCYIGLYWLLCLQKGARSF